MDENKLISLMQNFSGAKFQWVKTNRPELLGKVVTCRNIEPRGDRFFAMFDDGSTIDTAQINNSLMMLHGDMQPLSKAEVEAIYAPRPSITKPNVQPAKEDAPLKEGLAGTNGPGPDPMGAVDTRSDRHFTKMPPAANMFDMFNSEEVQISLNLSVKLPDKKLLRMMYASSEDKSKFLSQLSDYLLREINKTVVEEAITSIVAPAPIVKKQKPKPTPAVNIKEIHED